MKNEGEIREEYPNEQLLSLDIAQMSWYVDIVNFLASPFFHRGNQHI